MGSRARHSTGQKTVPIRARKGNPKTTHHSSAASDAAVSDAMDDLDEAICVVRVAGTAMESQQALEGRVRPEPYDADTLRTLIVGGRLLRRAYSRLDEALVAGVRS